MKLRAASRSSSFSNATSRSGGGPEHVQERPQCKALAPVLLEARKRQLSAPVSEAPAVAHSTQNQPFQMFKAVEPPRSGEGANQTSSKLVCVSELGQSTC